MPTPAAAATARMSTARRSPSAPSRAEFIAADLSLIEDGRRVVARLRESLERIDAPALAASFVRQRRHGTASANTCSSRGSPICCGPPAGPSS
ncbi:hypothetical protein AB0L25_03860 [Spirillospora sp. NPDC052242]